MNKKNISLIFFVIILLSLLSSCGKQNESQNYIAQDENPTYLVPISDKNTTNQLTDNNVSVLNESIDQPDLNDSLEKSFKLSSNNISGLTNKPCSNHITLAEIIEYGHIIKKLGGQILDPSSFKNDLIGFQNFLNQSGIQYFSAYEISHPRNIFKAKKCHLRNLVPPQGCWLRTAALTMIAQTIRGEINSPLQITSHYRTTCYNKSLSGAKHSDHLKAKAIDLSYKNSNYRQKAIKFVCKNFWKDDVFGLSGLKDNSGLNIQIGIGYTYTHLGIGSQGGKRYWIYKKFIEKNGELPESCWSKKLAWH